MYRAIGAIVTIAVAACGDQTAGVSNDADIAEPDAMMMPGPCWPDDGQTPGGWMTIGTGRDAHEPMPDPLPIEYGTQDGFDLVANIKMGGLVPGNPTNVFDSTNPRTRVRAFFADTNVPLNYYAHCPYRYGYTAAAEGYVMPTGLAIIFETCWRAQHLIGERVRIDVEIVDHMGTYARDSVTVTLAEPTSIYPKDEPPTPGCVH